MKIHQNSYDQVIDFFHSQARLITFVAQFVRPATVVTVLAALLRLTPHLPIEAKGLSLRRMAAAAITVDDIAQQIVLMSLQPGDAIGVWHGQPDSDQRVLRRSLPRAGPMC
jgi:hypothetical protein